MACRWVRCSRGWAFIGTALWVLGWYRHYGRFDGTHEAGSCFRVSALSVLWQ